MLHADLYRCLAEIAEIERYAGPRELGAMLGWADWLVEAMMICEEASAECP